MPVIARVRYFVFFFNDTATTEIYTLSLHDALPIFTDGRFSGGTHGMVAGHVTPEAQVEIGRDTSELQSQFHLVCRLLLEKKKNLPHCAAIEPSADEHPAVLSHPAPHPLHAIILTSL